MPAHFDCDEAGHRNDRRLRPHGRAAGGLQQAPRWPSRRRGLVKAAVEQTRYYVCAIIPERRLPHGAGERAKNDGIKF
jgi:hypothetical protein